MKKKTRRILSVILIFIILLLFLLGTQPGFDFLTDIALALFIPYAIISGKSTANQSVSYSYMSLALITALFLLFKNALS